MNETYVRYLEAKVSELKAQNKLLLDSVYHKESTIRTLKAETIYLNDQVSILRSGSQSVPPFNPE